MGKWIGIVFMFFLGLNPHVVYATIATPNHVHQTNAEKDETTSGQKVKKERPRKQARNWLKKNKGFLIYGASVFSGALLIAFGFVKAIKWMWILGVLVIGLPIFLVLLFVILFIIFGKKRPRPPLMPVDPIEEQPKSETDKEEKNENTTE